MEVSPSQLKVFGDCSRQWYYKYQLGLDGEQVNAYTVLGSVFHYAMDVYETYGHDIDLAVRTFRHYWNNLDELDLRIDIYPPKGLSHEKLEERGVDMLERYHSMEPFKGGILVGTEIEFRVPLGEHVITGIIDKLWLRPQKRELEVIDFKTGASVPEKLRHNVQFTSYMYATTRPEFWQEIPGFEEFWVDSLEFKRKGAWYHARNSKMYNCGYRGDLDYRRLLMAVESMAACVEADAYPLTISGEACGYCGFIDICGTEVASPLSDVIKHPEVVFDAGS